MPTSTETTSATPNAIESAVNDDANERCVILRQAIVRRFMGIEEEKS